ncbi:hypothetical protein CJP72_00705, partial [Citrobacter sp. NCU1]|nr:hypothetical protein [Citrobacter sp. NCU1]
LMMFIRRFTDKKLSTYIRTSHSIQPLPLFINMKQSHSRFRYALPTCAVLSLRNLGAKKARSGVIWSGQTKHTRFHGMF